MLYQCLLLEYDSASIFSFDLFFTHCICFHIHVMIVYSHAASQILMHPEPSKLCGKKGCKLLTGIYCRRKIRQPLVIGVDFVSRPLHHRSVTRQIMHVRGAELQVTSDARKLAMPSFEEVSVLFFTFNTLNSCFADATDLWSFLLCFVRITFQIYVEVERARLSRKLAAIKESEGNISGVCNGRLKEVGHEYIPVSLLMLFALVSAMEFI